MFASPVADRVVFLAGELCRLSIKWTIEENIIWHVNISSCATLIIQHYIQASVLYWQAKLINISALFIIVHTCFRRTRCRWRECRCRSPAHSTTASDSYRKVPQPWAAENYIPFCTSSTFLASKNSNMWRGLESNAMHSFLDSWRQHIFLQFLVRTSPRAMWRCQ